jgi:hypothetical protein
VRSEFCRRFVSIFEVKPRSTQAVSSRLKNHSEIIQGQWNGTPFTRALLVSIGQIEAVRESHVGWNEVVL